MKTNQKAGWRLLWLMLAANLVLLIVALFAERPAYLVSSVLWSLGILWLHQKMNRPPRG